MKNQELIEPTTRDLACLPRYGFKKYPLAAMFYEWHRLLGTNKATLYVNTQGAKLIYSEVTGIWELALPNGEDGFGHDVHKHAMLTELIKEHADHPALKRSDVPPE